MLYAHILLSILRLYLKVHNVYYKIYTYMCLKNNVPKNVCAELGQQHQWVLFTWGLRSCLLETAFCMLVYVTTDHDRDGQPIVSFMSHVLSALAELISLICPSRYHKGGTLVNESRTW